jgi:hypothetical protein
MELKPEARGIILNYLKDGQREMAVTYISLTFHISHHDSSKLLDVFETQFSKELKNPKSKSFDAATCSGCLSRILKIIAIFIGILSIGIYALGYFFVDWFGDNWNNRRVPVIITGAVYARPDSSYMNLIYEYRGSETKTDTGTIEYEPKSFQVGDTIQVTARDLGLGFDEETKKVLAGRQQIFYLISGGVFLAALIFWVVGSVFKVSPPSKETGRYSR